jgi:hypothetical protein
MATAGATGGVIKVEGLEALYKKLEALGASKKEFVDVNFRAAKTLRDAVRPLVPTSEGSRGENGRLYQYKAPGALKASVRASKGLGYASVMAGNARVPYANPVHWGWFEDKDNFVKKNIKPNLFIYRAIDSTKDRIMAQYNEDMQNILNKYGLGE